jgi:sarcosine oxidase, subunit beta
VLVERDSLASGSTSKSAGGIRTQFADELNIRIALRSLVEFEAISEEISFVQNGYLFLLDREEDVASFRDAVALQQSLGVPSCVLSAAEARELVPQLVVDDVLAATFCPRDGTATPESVVQWYARESGARILQS